LNAVNNVQVLGDVEFKEPRIPVYSNVTAEPFADAASVPGMLARQLVEPVRWEDIMVKLTKLGKNQFYELGPGSQLKAMVKRIDTPVWKTMKNVSV
jgi:[acyl-carrier-protein] S-malonyltransferase